MDNLGNEKGVHSATEGGSYGPSVEQLTIDEKRLLLKIDLRILPILCVVYLMAFIDRYDLPYNRSHQTDCIIFSRVNIGNAQLFSLPQDLQLTTHEYNVALAVFFVSYIIFEIPANVIMRRVKPHIFSTCSASFSTFAD